MAESRTPLKKFQTRSVDSATSWLTGCLDQLDRLHPEHPQFSANRATVINRQGGILFEAPTGTGKTLMAGTTAEKLSLSGHKILWFWFAPFDGLVTQSAATLRSEFSNLRVRELATDREVATLACPSP